MGHNRGPSMEGGVSWRRHCRAAAREALLPVLPVEVVRTRVRRAAALGLDYRAYAGVRAATGHDLVAFLFSSNALRVSALRPVMADARAAKLAGVQAGCGGWRSRPWRRPQWRRPIRCWKRALRRPVRCRLGGEVRASLRAALGKLAADQVLPERVAFDRLNPIKRDSLQAQV